MTMPHFQSDRCWNLPPLILHPFADHGGKQKLAQSSRAALILEGLLPEADIPREQLERDLVEGRLCELRMLYYVGKDLSRWLDQCADAASRDLDLLSAHVNRYSFMELLVENTPTAVHDKLVSWGVVDHRAVFSRALGLHAVFGAPPRLDALNADFVKNYFRFADAFYDCCRQDREFSQISSHNFRFELYASAEYSRILEKQWSEAAS